jgi:hypothetical protein
VGVLLLRQEEDGEQGFVGECQWWLFFSFVWVTLSVNFSGQHVFGVRSQLRAWQLHMHH